MKSKKTSIVILTYNNLEYTKMCIESIRKYTANGTYEIIVVDNNSKDGTKEWLEQQKDLRCKLNKKNLGFPKGCNQGIKMSEGDSILLLNNDVIVAPNWLDNLSNCLYSSDNIGAVGPTTNNCSYYQSIPAGYNGLDEMIEFAEAINISSPEKWEERLKLIGFCMLIKREAIEKAGLLDERFSPGNFEDDDYSFRIRKAGYRLMLCKDTFVHHFGSASFKASGKKFGKAYFEGQRKFIEKWGFDSSYSTIIRQDIISLLDKPADERIAVLETGCACGATLLKIKSLYKNAELYGIELNKAAADIANTVAHVTAQDIETGNLNFKEGYFDYIIFADVLEHLFDPWKVLKEIRKYLKSDGCLLASIPNVMHFSVIRNLINGCWTYEDAGILDRTHVRFFTLNEIIRMFKESGYKDLSITGTAVGKSNEDEAFIQALSQLSGADTKAQYGVYQYLVKARGI